eukprot:109005-Amphidinium_carterae.1
MPPNMSESWGRSQQELVEEVDEDLQELEALLALSVREENQSRLRKAIAEFKVGVVAQTPLSPLESGHIIERIDCTRLRISKGVESFADNTRGFSRLLHTEI